MTESCRGRSVTTLSPPEPPTNPNTESSKETQIGEFDRLPERERETILALAGKLSPEVAHIMLSKLQIALKARRIKFSAARWFSGLIENWEADQKRDLLTRVSTEQQDVAVAVLTTQGNAADITAQAILDLRVWKKKATSS